MNKISTPLDLKSLKITDSFWKKEMELVRKEVIPYQWEALNDRVKDAAPSYCMRNFKIAGKMNQEKHRLGKRMKNQNIPSVALKHFRRIRNIWKTSFMGLSFRTVIFQNGLKRLLIP